MNTLRTTVTALLFSALCSPVAMAEPIEYKIDPDHFSVLFAVNHLGFDEVLGLFRKAKGRFTYDREAGELTEGQVIIQSKSVFTNHKERDEHLCKADFLDCRKYPNITFVVTGFEKQSANAGVLHGKLTLLGQTRPVALDLTLNKSGVYPFGHEKFTLGFSASTTLRRSEWGMDYGLDPMMVGDDVKLRFEFEAYDDSGWF
ncbi:YceI family protein [Marinobacter halodurans]|uniref:YceI family protein n=1 Tax=Marinobacter halodurans TaxID=2528979 RepID=A0ABY1ZGQ8_9GAMM|nr:YceI family protein [Marinobacter halodurans]TBW51547.1 YceI family protein [Marinobacter halodurans]